MGMPEENVLVVENGYILEFTQERATIGERVPGGYVFVDGSGVGDVGPSLLHEREQLANDGFVVVVVTLDPEGGLLAPPRILTRGFVYQPEATALLEGIAAQVAQTVEQRVYQDAAELEDALRRGLQDYFYRQIKRRPVVIPVVSA
jgi:ribonuclease J